MRAAAQLALEQWALERAGLLEEEPYRRGHRVRILEHALAPLAPTLPAAVRDRLHRALSVVYGIEPYMILKDIWGLPDREVERIALWMADALIDAALRDAARRRSRVRRAARRRRRGPGRSGCRHEGRVRRSRRRHRAADAAGMVRRAVQQPRPHPRASGDPAPVGRALAPRAREPRRACSTSPTAATRASGSTSSRRKRRARRSWSTSTAATGARSTSAISRSSRRPSSLPVRWSCTPNYALCPAVTIEHIVLQLVRSLAWVWRHAGRARRRPVAHRRRRPLGRRPPRGDDAGVRLARGRARPARRSRQGRARRLRRVRARAAAPRAVPGAGHRARRRAGAEAQPGGDAGAAGRLVAVVGGDESEEFLRQNALIADAWGAGVVSVCEQVPGRHHMDVLHELADPASRTHRLALRLLGL